MTRLVSIIFAVFFCVFYCLSAEAQISAAQKVPDQAIKFNEDVLNDFLKRDVKAVLNRALPEVQVIENIETDLVKFMDYLPAYEDGKNYQPFLREVRRTDDSNSSQAIYRTRYELNDLNIEGQSKDSWATVDIFSQETKDGLKFRHFSFKAVPHQPTKVGTFDIKNKSIQHYLFLALLIAVPIFILATIATIIRNKHMTKKWFWGIFSAFGLWGLNLNWFTGKISTKFITVTSNAEGIASWNFKLISFQLLGASFGKASQYSPYVISIGLPLGAILYWILKHRDKNIHQEFE